MLTTEQKLALKADIAADPAFAGIVHNSDGAFAVAAVYALPAVPDFWVWRTSLPQYEIVSTVSADATSWSWTAYISRSQGERDGWREMFTDTGAINPSLPNVRQGLGDIFSGPSGAGQRTHLLVIGRRIANRVEKLLAAGDGGSGTPATMGFEGTLSYQDVLVAWNTPDA